MTISYNWLKEYVKCDLGAEEIARILTDIGLEVEALEKSETVKGGLAGLVVGEVLTCSKHPDADKLNITTVNIGEPEPLQIVCGAPNVAAGQKVIVATCGTTLYPSGGEEEFKIKKSKIRGVESFGMICAEDEIGVGASHDGIIVLPADTKVGTPASELFGAGDDYIIEIGLTPNRVDAASHYGVARDLAAYLKSNNISSSLDLPSTASFSIDNTSLPALISVENSEACPRYMGITMSGVKVEPSPEWLQKRLLSIGMNPKNNVVDITNFILHELGQPLHAFDYDKIEGGKITVRTCDEGTKFTTLDGVERSLSSSDLMICSETRPMCIAGVFGGMDSGVTDETSRIFIESAYFNPVWVRKTAKRHGLSTDSSFRFERGTDPNMPCLALKRAADMIREIAGGKITSEITDIYPAKIEDSPAELSYTRINRLIGKELSRECIKSILAGLEIRIMAEDGDNLSVMVPAYRVDVKREADVVEDILRIYGYNNIEIPKLVKSGISIEERPDKDHIINIISSLMTASGYTEIMSNSLTKSAYYTDLTAYKAENCVKILNPLSNDLNVMRQTLIFNALEAVELNTNRKNGDLKLFEFGNCYFYNPEKVAEGGLAPYSEKYKLGVVVTGLQTKASWNAKSAKSNFFTIKAIAQKLLQRFGINIDEAVIETLTSDLYSEAVTFGFRGKPLFEIGVVAPKIKAIFDLKTNVYYMELDFDMLMKMLKKHKITVTELSKFPEVKRDLALMVDKKVTFSELREIAIKSEKKLLKSVSLFDVYEGDKLPEGKKSYALTFILEDTTKTLNDTIIDKTMANLIRQFEQQVGATIR